MTNPNYASGWRGSGAMIKTSGAGPISVATQINFPFLAAFPSNPDPKESPGVVNAASFESVEFLGKKTPSIRLIMPAKHSWFTQNLLLSLVLSYDSLFSSDVWAIGLNNNYQTRVYDYCRCMMVMLSQQATGAWIVTMDFLCLYGDSEAPTPTTFATVTPDPGQLFDVTSTSWSGTADQVKAKVLQLMRVQRYVPYDNGTRYFSDIASGGFGGTLSLSQSPTYNVSPGSSATLNIGTTGAGVSLSLLLSALGYSQMQDTSLDTRIRAYALRDIVSAGNPCVITAL